MSYAICYNLDQFKGFSSGNGLTQISRDSIVCIYTVQTSFAKRQERI